MDLGAVREGMCDAGALASWAIEELNLKEKAFKHI